MSTGAGWFAARTPELARVAGRNIVVLGPIGPSLSIVARHIVGLELGLTVLPWPEAADGPESGRLLEGLEGPADGALECYLGEISRGASAVRVSSRLIMDPSLLGDVDACDAVLDLRATPVTLPAVTAWARERRVPLVLCHADTDTIEVVSCPPEGEPPASFAARTGSDPTGPADVLAGALGLGEVLRRLGGVKARPEDRLVHVRYGLPPDQIPRWRRVLVAGCGNLGSHVGLLLCSLARLLDPSTLLDVFFLDRPGEVFQERNLSSTPTAHPGVIGVSKSSVLTALATRGHGRLRATAVHTTLTSPADTARVLRELRPDVVFRALDSNFASWLLHEACLQEGVPMVYAALSPSAGTLRLVETGGACLDCALRLATKARQQASNAHAPSASCADRPANVAQSGAVMASLAVMESLRRDGRLRGSLLYDLSADDRLTTLTTPADAGCVHLPRIRT